MKKERARKLTTHEYQQGPIVYWMNRDERTADNWALIFADQWAKKLGKPLIVLFNLIEDFLGGGLRQLDFKIKNLQHIEEHLRAKNIPFLLITGEKSDEKILEKLEEIEAGGLVTDFSPLRICKKWQASMIPRLQIPWYEIDAHNIVPCWTASQKQEFGAYTLRPKLHRLLPEFLDEFPKIERHPFPWTKKYDAPDWNAIVKKAKTDRSIQPVPHFVSGEKAAQTTLKNFLQNTLNHYAEDRNDPNKSALSNLSPYLHYGQISAQRVALETLKFVDQYPLLIEDRKISREPNANAFLEELIIRRELSDNYCFYNSDYDNFNGFPTWAQKTLNEHRSDPREHLYSLEEFQNAQTHDDLWNAAQMEMVNTGKMHGYLRMYWAKKILEWTLSPEEAQKIAITLNDRYELDGRDPNGYTGIAWSIGGVHDRAWFNRPIYGKIRYMSANGCQTKFDTKTYIQKNKKP